MKPAILDTTVASFLFRDAPELALYEDELAGRRFSVSFHTIAELLYGALAARWGKERRERLRSFARGLRVHAYEYGLAKAWATVMDEATRRGRSLNEGDAWIAATALFHRAPLFTHDADFVFEEPIPGLDVVCHAPEEEVEE